MIKLELEVTPTQMIDIALVMDGKLTTVHPGEIQVTAPPPSEVEEIVIDTPAGTVTVTADEQTAQFDKLDSMVKPESPPVIPSAPVSPSATAFAADVETADGVELAKGTNGQMIPWDVRIHGKAKKQNADGSWRLIQGVDRDTLVPQVEAELVAALTAPKPVTSVVVTDTQQAGNPTLNTTTQTVTDTPAQDATVQEVQTSAGGNVPAPPTAADKPSTFAELLPLVTAAKAAGTLTDETIANTCVELGLAQFGLIATRPDLIPRAAELLGV